MNGDTFWRDKAFKHDFVTSSALAMWLATLIWACLQLLSSTSHWATHHTYICRCSEKGSKKVIFQAFKRSRPKIQSRAVAKQCSFLLLEPYKKCFPTVKWHHVAEWDPGGKRLPCCSWSFSSQASRQLFLVAGYFPLEFLLYAKV